MFTNYIDNKVLQRPNFLLFFKKLLYCELSYTSGILYPPFICQDFLLIEIALKHVVNPPLLYHVSRLINRRCLLTDLFDDKNRD